MDRRARNKDENARQQLRYQHRHGHEHERPPLPLLAGDVVEREADGRLGHCDAEKDKEAAAEYYPGGGYGVLEKLDVPDVLTEPAADGCGGEDGAREEDELWVKVGRSVRISVANFGWSWCDMNNLHRKIPTTGRQRLAAWRSGACSRT